MAQNVSDSERVIDARGLRCPMPLLYAKRALAESGPGDAFELIGTDESSIADIERFVRKSGWDFTIVKQFDDHYRIRIAKEQP
ncbi:MAG: sulfurtransferase TusA family protein [Pseudomonadota bacterium]